MTAPTGDDSSIGLESLIELHAQGLLDDPEDIRRIESSPELRARVELARRNNAFLDGVAEVSRSGIDERAAFGLPSPIPGYEILQEIHRGGQGVVYRARQTPTKRPVALKVLFGSALRRERARQRFEREVELAARLNHPNIVTVYAGGVTADGLAYLSMELIEGRPISRATLDGAYGPEILAGARVLADLRTMAEIADAVQYAHQRGVIHRDLKPSNILVEKTGRARIVDFGLAKTVDEGAAEATMSGEFIGTLAYAAPEQVSGKPELVDTRTDVYALGCILYELLTRARPVPVSGAMDVAVRNIREYSPAPPSSIAPGLERDIDAIVLTALSKEPERRYQSAAEFAADLRRCAAGEAVLARGDSALYLLRKAARRHWVAGTLVLGGVVGLAMVSLLMVFLYREASENEALALRTSESLSESLLEARVQRAMAHDRAEEISLAEETLWRLALTQPAEREARGADPRLAGFPGHSWAYWRLWSLYCENPCRKTVQLPVTERTDWRACRTKDDRACVVVSDLWRVERVYEGATLEEMSVDDVSPVPSGVRVRAFAADDRWLDVWDERSRSLMVPSATGMGRVCLPERPLLCYLAGSALFVMYRDMVLERYDAGAQRASWSVDLLPMLGREGSHTDELTSTPDGSRVFIVSSAVGRALVINGRTGEVEDRIDGIGTSYSSCAISSEGRLFACRLADRIAVFDLETGEERDFPSTNINALLFVMGDTRLLAGAEDGMVALFDLGRWPAHQTWRGHGHGSRPVLSGTADGVVTFDGSNALKLWDVRPSAGTMRVELGPDPCSVAYAPDGRLLAIGYGSGAVHLVDSTIGATLWSARPCEVEAPGEVTHVSGIRFLGEDRLAAVSRSGMLVVLSVADGRTLSAYHPPRVDASAPDDARALRGFNSIAPHPSGEILAVGRGDGAVCFFTPKGELVRELATSERRLSEVVFSPDGRLVACTSLETRVYEYQSGRLVATLERDAIFYKRSVAFSPGGELLAVCGDDRAITLHSTRDWSEVRTLRGHNARVFALAFSPDGRLLLTGDSATDAKLWDVETGRELVSWSDLPRMVMDVAWRPDGMGLALACSHHGAVLTYDLRAFAAHVAGNAQFWRERLMASGESCPLGGAIEAWAERALGGVSGEGSRRGPTAPPPR